MAILGLSETNDMRIELYFDEVKQNSFHMTTLHNLSNLVNFTSKELNQINGTFKIKVIHEIEKNL